MLRATLHQRVTRKISGGAEEGDADDGPVAKRARMDDRPAASGEGSADVAQPSGRVERKAGVNYCSHAGCDNVAHVAGGVCIRHDPGCRLCTHEGCTKYAKKGGVCVSHGARLPRCTAEGCTNAAFRKGKLCERHAGIGTRVRKFCGVEGCPNRVRSGGLCETHGAKRKERRLCGFEGCTNQAKKGGVCLKHGSVDNRKECKVGGCATKAISHGVCARHGANRYRKRCSVEGCIKHAVKGGVCWCHGAREMRTKG